MLKCETHVHPVCPTLNSDIKELKGNADSAWTEFWGGKKEEQCHTAILIHMFQILLSVYILSYLLCTHWLNHINIFSTLIVILGSGDLIGAQWRLFEGGAASAFEVQEGGRRGMKAEHPDMTGRWSINDFLFWGCLWRWPTGWQMCCLAAHCVDKCCWRCRNPREKNCDGNYLNEFK